MVTLSFDASVTFNGPGGVGFYVLRILNGSGAIVADTGLQNMVAGTNSYSISAMVPAFGMAPNDTYAAFVSIEAVAGAIDNTSTLAIIDNVSIEAELVPAPSAMALLGLGGLAAKSQERR